MPAASDRSPQPDVVAAFAAEVVQLQSPRGRVLPWRVRRFLPNPCASLEQYERFLCADVACLGRHEVQQEFARLTLALATIHDVLDVPIWLWRRRDVLRQRLFSGRAA